MIKTQSALACCYSCTQMNIRELNNLFLIYSVFIYFVDLFYARTKIRVLMPKVRVTINGQRSNYVSKLTGNNQNEFHQTSWKGKGVSYKIWNSLPKVKVS